MTSDAAALTGPGDQRGGTATTVVVPTVGRASLDILLTALERGSVPPENAVVVVDDRAGEVKPLEIVTALPVRVVRSGGRGPAAARNLGWRVTDTPWVSFLDDDVIPDPDWFERLREDLATAVARGEQVVATQGQLTVPLPRGRRPTDWERTTASLEGARWITADMSFRRAALAARGGFDERFPRAYREDAELALRLTGRGGEIVAGNRHVTHPVRPADAWVSVRTQRGNADDQLMARLHGRRWRERAGSPPGRRPRHLATVAAAGLALAAASTRRRRLARLAAGAWMAGTAELAVARISPGPRTRQEVGRMVATSALIPFAATWHTARGAWTHRRAQPWRGIPELLLFDRDGTLVHDVPYNGDPDRVRLVPGVREALDRARDAGVKIGLVTNQSGVARGYLTPEQVQGVNARLEQLAGPFDVVRVCAHGPGDGCSCRKPQPGMVLAACEQLGVHPRGCVLIGDTATDVQAADRAGATGLLVPNPVTLPVEVEEARRAGRLHDSVTAAVDHVLSGVW